MQDTGVFFYLRFHLPPNPYVYWFVSLICNLIPCRCFFIFLCPVALRYPSSSSSSSSTAHDDVSVSDEQDQVAIAKILANSFAAGAGSRSSPAVLANPETAQLLPITSSIAAPDGSIRYIAVPVAATATATTATPAMAAAAPSAAAASPAHPSSAHPPHMAPRDIVSAPVHAKAGRVYLPSQTAQNGGPLYMPRHVSNWRSVAAGAAEAMPAVAVAAAVRATREGRAREEEGPCGLWR